MNNIVKVSQRRGRTFFLYGLSFILLLEWLLPLPFITDTGYISIFVCYAFFSFLLTYLQFPLWLSILLRVLAAFFGLGIMFYAHSLLSLEWLQLLFADIAFNTSLIITGEWLYLTDLFRSFLFFMLLAVMSYLLYYWTVQVKRILFFLLLTVMYITVVDTFTSYDATFAIIRTFIAGFLLLGLLTLYRTLEQEKVVSHSRALTSRLVMILIFAIVFASAFGYVAPKLNPQWPDPVPYVKMVLGIETTGGGMLRQQMIGYSNSDAQLGGGFDYDNTPVFFALTSKGNYWRGESKNFYTGKGWDVTTPDTVRENAVLFEEGVVTEEETASIMMAGDYVFPHLFYGGELSSVAFHTASSIGLQVDAHTGKAMTFYNDQPAQLENYTLFYEYPQFSVSGLRESGENDPGEIREYYLQLPETLPDRVGELAAAIVDGYSNRYDKVKAVEQFFSRSGYRYETEDVAIPTGDEDYVDQFLFETMQGYCDNFSTSMAVLLRTVGIPTRWVKGFTQGEWVDGDRENRRYLVTNANAHSWVEVYFPGHGWVPFEPTSGFNHGFDFVIDRTNPDDIDWEKEDVEQEIPEIEDVMADGEEEETSASYAGEEQRSLFPIFVLLLLIILVAVAFFLNRKRLIALYLLSRFKKSNDVHTFEKAFEKLIWFIGINGLPKQANETLREYAQRIDERYYNNDMSRLTTNYEKVSYGKESPEKIWRESRSLWERLIKKSVLDRFLGD